MREPHGMKILCTSPAKGGWRAVYAVRGEDGRAKIEEERIGLFALCEDEEGKRFVSGVRGNGELCATRNDFVGHFSIKQGWHKIRDAAEGFVRAKEQEKGNPL
jgi:hypothetical protein